MKRISRHKILLAGESLAHCKEQVNRYFDLTTLVIYDCIEVPDDLCVSGLNADFFEQIYSAEKQNRGVVRGLIEELQESGLKTTDDLSTIEQGYVSKVFHVLSHFLDGFIGIDSYFFNLLDDSHWLTEATATRIKQDPSRYWLLHLDCFSMTPEEAGIVHLNSATRTKAQPKNEER